MDCKDKFYQNLLLNDTIDISKNFIGECEEMIKSINSLDGSLKDYDLMLIFKAISMYDDINTRITYIKSFYKMINDKEIDSQKLKGCLDTFNLFNNLPKYTQNENLIKIMISDFENNLDSIINQYTSYKYFYDLYDKDAFTKERLPLIRIIKYCLKNNLFEVYSKIARRLEPRIINIFFDTYSKEIKQIINNNRNNSDLLYLFIGLEENNLNDFFTDTLTQLLENASFKLIFLLITEDIPKKYIVNDYFEKSFTKFDLGNQTSILNALSNFEYPKEFILNLRKHLNKSTKDDNRIEAMLGITDGYFRLLYYVISNSSYFRKYNIKDSELWKIIEAIYNNEEFKVNENINLYEHLTNLYYTCYKYATESIINSLYPIDNLKDEITYLEDIKFNILAVGDNVYGCDIYNDTTVDDLFANKNFTCAHILTENNFSHMSDARHLFGFYTNIIPSSIVKIILGEIVLPRLYSKYEKDISKERTLLLDIVDLNNVTLNLNTFNTICFRTKTNNNQPIKPNCIICFDEITQSDLNFAKKFNQKILVLKRNPHTIENNEINNYRGQGELDF